MKSKHYKIDFKVINREIDILNLARSLGLEIKGKTARCIYSSQHKHQDRDFSMKYNARANKFRCFPCGKSWSVIDLYKEIKGITSTYQAGKELGELAGLTIARESVGPITSPVEASKRPQVEPKLVNLPTRTKDFKIYADLMAFCGGVDSKALAYLTGPERGLNKETIERFKLFSIRDGPEANRYLKSKYSLDELKRAGLVYPNGNFVFNQHRLIIPFLDGEQPSYLQGRQIDGGKVKYQNLYGLQVPLFNAEILKTIRPGERVYICEGVFDAIILEQHGRRAVAILGAGNFKDHWTELFKGLDVILALDNDKTGARDTARLKELFQSRGQYIKSKHLPEGIKDITEFFCNVRKV